VLNPVKGGKQEERAFRDYALLGLTNHSDVELISCPKEVNLSEDNFCYQSK
jgi:hypothetical protein